MPSEIEELVRVARNYAASYVNSNDTAATLLRTLADELAKTATLRRDRGEWQDLAEKSLKEVEHLTEQLDDAILAYKLLKEAAQDILSWDGHIIPVYNDEFLRRWQVAMRLADALRQTEERFGAERQVRIR